MHFHVVISVRPKDGQSQEAAEAEFGKLFKQYLEMDPDNPTAFREYYGIEFKGDPIQGGYEGPWADAATYVETDERWQAIEQARKTLDRVHFGTVSTDDMAEVL